MTVLDTHTIVKRLKDAGFTDVQAETVTDVLRQTRELDLSQLVTRDYLDSRLTELESRLRAEIADVKADLLKWLVPLLLGQAALIAALVRLL
jgi:hypothetical protein